MSTQELNLFAQIQKKQIILTVTLSALAMTIGAVLSAFIVKDVYGASPAYAASAFKPVSVVQPADVTTDTTGTSSDVCTAPASQTLSGGMGGGVVTTASTPAVSNFEQEGSAGGGTMPMSGGRGAGPVPTNSTPPVTKTISYSTLTYTISKYQDSNNTYGSNNGSGNTVTNNSTQGFYNTVSGKGSIDQLNLSGQKAENNTNVDANKDGNGAGNNTTNNDSNNSVKNVAVDSGNTKNITADNGNTANLESGNTTNTNSGNTLTADNGNKTNIDSGNTATLTSSGDSDHQH